MSAVVSGEPSWTEVRVRVPAGWEELVADALAQEGATSAAIEACAADEVLVRAYLVVRADDAQRRARVAARLAGLAERAGAPELAGLEPAFAHVAHADWANAWRARWRPFRVGRVCVLGHDHPPPPRRGDVALRLEPGSAFGTGRHATTRACLLAVQRRVRPGQRVLDAGTGTGILAVAAALFGARRCDGFDLDPLAPPVARALAEANGVAERCRFFAGGFDALAADALFDGVCANIYADVVCARAEEIVRAGRRGAWFAVSGCAVDKREPVLAALAGAGLDVRGVDRRGRWLTIEGERR